MSKETLTVHFGGICTHFRGVVPGIPHRVVVPDASPARTGRVQVGSKPADDYRIYPHIACVATEGESIEYKGFIEGGRIINGVRMEIANAVGPLEWKGSFEKILRLAHYVPHYRPSAEVVHGGRARLYFDFFSGCVTTETRNKEIHACVEIRTNGVPILQVTPLMVERQSNRADVRCFPLESGQLTVANWGNACKKRSTYDFLLNYLTAEGGIPHVVSADFPVEVDASADAFLDPFAGPTSEQLVDCLGNEGELLMCSDSRYP